MVLKEQLTVWTIRDLVSISMLFPRVSDHYKVLFYDMDILSWINVLKGSLTMLIRTQLMVFPNKKKMWSDFTPITLIKQRITCSTRRQRHE